MPFQLQAMSSGQPVPPDFAVVARTEDLPASAHPKIRTCWDWWSRLRDRRGGAIPARRDLDPTEVPQLLAGLWLCDIVGDPPRFRFRLIGQSIKDMGFAGRPGGWVEDIVEPDAPAYLDMQRLAAEGTATWRRGVAQARHEVFRMFTLERIFLPLAADGVRPDALLGCTVFFRSDGAAV